MKNALVLVRLIGYTVTVINTDSKKTVVITRQWDLPSATTSSVIWRLSRTARNRLWFIDGYCFVVLFTRLTEIHLCVEFNNLHINTTVDILNSYGLFDTEINFLENVLCKARITKIMKFCYKTATYTGMFLNVLATCYIQSYRDNIFNHFLASPQHSLS